MQSLEQSFPGRGNGMASYLRVNPVKRAETFRIAGGKRKSEVVWCKIGVSGKGYIKNLSDLGK